MIYGRAASQSVGTRWPGEKYQQTDMQHVVIPYCFKWEYSRDKKRRRKSFKMWLTSTDLQPSSLSLSAADFLRLMPKFIFLGVELPELQLMDWPDAQVIATVWTSICLCLSRRGGQWLELDQSEDSYIWNEMYNIAIDSCCTPLSIEPI